MDVTSQARRNRRTSEKQTAWLKLLSGLEGYGTDLSVAINRMTLPMLERRRAAILDILDKIDARIRWKLEHGNSEN
jgi:hypothetical protein